MTLLPWHTPSPHLVREEEDGRRGEKLSVLLSGGSALDYSSNLSRGHEWSNLLCFDPSSYLRSDLPLYPLYAEVGRVHGSLREFSLWSTCARVHEGFAAAWMDLGVVVEQKKPWMSSGCSVLTPWVSGSIGLDWPPLGTPFVGFLVVKASSLRGWYDGGAWKPPSPWSRQRAFFPLCHASCVTLQRSGW